MIAQATPYPWPYHGDFDAARTALVALLDRRWRLAGAGADDSDACLAELAGALAARGALVVAVAFAPRRRAIALGGGDGLGDAAKTLGVVPGAVIAAAATSAFHGSPLDDVLRVSGREDLVVAGWGLEGPVHSTLRAANDRGYECLLVPDASSSLDPTLVAASAEMVRFSGGIFGAVGTTADVLAALTATAGAT